MIYWRCARGKDHPRGRRCDCDPNARREVDARYERDKRDRVVASLYTRAWRKRSAAYLRAHPICAVCGVAATEVDHVVPHHGDRVIFWRADNLQSLCGACHGRKTRSE